MRWESLREFLSSGENIATQTGRADRDIAPCLDGGVSESTDN